MSVGGPRGSACAVKGTVSGAVVSVLANGDADLAPPVLLKLSSLAGADAIIVAAKLPDGTGYIPPVTDSALCSTDAEEDALADAAADVDGGAANEADVSTNVDAAADVLAAADALAAAAADPFALG